MSVTEEIAAANWGVAGRVRAWVRDPDLLTYEALRDTCCRLARTDLKLSLRLCRELDQAAWGVRVALLK